MTPESAHILNLARRVVRHYLALPELRAAMVTGSAAEGHADRYSDLDLILYAESLPGEAALAAARDAAGGGPRIWVLGSPEHGSIAEAFEVDGIQVQAAMATMESMESTLEAILSGHEVGGPTQKVASGLLAGVDLHGAEILERWRSRAAAYPDTLAEAMVRHHLQFFPLWGMTGCFLPRDAALWRMQSLLEAAFNILGVLAGLNRVYHASFQFKRMRRFTSKLRLAPPNLDERLEWLLATSDSAAVEDLERLVGETLDLVDAHLPSVDTTAARRRLGWRQQPWPLP